MKNQEGCDNFEIIVVDGGSSDATVKIAKRYADTTVISQERGPSMQRNLGARMATGSLLAFIDADTVASKFWLKCIVETLQDQSVACVTGPLFPLEKIKRPYLYHITNTLQKILVRINYPLFWGASCAFRTNDFWKIDGFDEKLLTSEDHDISLRIRKIGKVVFDDDIVWVAPYPDSCVTVCDVVSNNCVVAGSGIYYSFCEVYDSHILDCHITYSRA